MTDHSGFRALFDPRGVVVAGASSHPGKFGFVALHNLLSQGYRGEVFATNRGGALVRVEGLRGFIPGSHISTRKPKEDLVADFLPGAGADFDAASALAAVPGSRGGVSHSAITW